MMFLSSLNHVSKVVELGIIIRGPSVPTMFLDIPVIWVTLSNVPLFLRNDKRSEDLVYSGKITNSIHRITLGCKAPELRHVQSFRKQVFVILKDGAIP